MIRASSTQSSYSSTLGGTTNPYQQTYGPSTSTRRCGEALTAPITLRYAPATRLPKSELTPPDHDLSHFQHGQQHRLCQHSLGQPPSARHQGLELDWNIRNHDPPFSKGSAYPSTSASNSRHTPSPTEIALKLTSETGSWTRLPLECRSSSIRSQEAYTGLPQRLPWCQETGTRCQSTPTTP